MDIEYNTVGKRLQYIRKLLGISRQQLADKLGIPASKVRHWETADNISVNDLVQYLSVLKKYYNYSMSLDKFLDFETSTAFSICPKKLRNLKKLASGVDRKILLNHHIFHDNTSEE
jgi:transcriptional regulator with XRE-family HTH domain